MSPHTYAHVWTGNVNMSRIPEPPSSSRICLTGFGDRGRGIWPPLLYFNPCPANLISVCTRETPFPARLFVKYLLILVWFVYVKCLAKDYFFFRLNFKNETKELILEISVLKSRFEF